MTYFWKTISTNLNKIIQKKKNLNLKDCFEKNSNFFLKTFPKKQSPKGAPMAPISPLAYNSLLSFITPSY
jgi:hypothetical protein